MNAFLSNCILDKQVRGLINGLIWVKNLCSGGAGFEQSGAGWSRREIQE